MRKLKPAHLGHLQQRLQLYLHNTPSKLSSVLLTHARISYVLYRIVTMLYVHGDERIQDSRSLYVLDCQGEMYASPPFLLFNAHLSFLLPQGRLNMSPPPFPLPTLPLV